jgi:hypothetical protein
MEACRQCLQRAYRSDLACKMFGTTVTPFNGFCGARRILALHTGHRIAATTTWMLYSERQLGHIIGNPAGLVWALAASSSAMPPPMSAPVAVSDMPAPKPAPATTAFKMWKSSYEATIERT